MLNIMIFPPRINFENVEVAEEAKTAKIGQMFCLWLCWNVEEMWWYGNVVIVWQTCILL